MKIIKPCEEWGHFRVPWQNGAAGSAPSVQAKTSKRSQAFTPSDEMENPESTKNTKNAKSFFLGGNVKLIKTYHETHQTDKVTKKNRAARPELQKVDLRK